MDITINQITPREENGEITNLKVYFTGTVAGINFNGPVTLEKDDFEAFIQPTEMKGAVQQKIVNMIINGEAPPEAE